MNTDKIIDKLIRIIFALGDLLVNILPEAIVSRLGKALGYIVYYLAGHERRLAWRNINNVDIGQYNKKEKKEIIISACKHFGQMIMELFLIKNIDQNNLSRHFDYENLNILEEAKAQNRGIIIYTAHFGNWEWLGPALSRKGYPTTAIVEKQDYGDKALNDIRRSGGTEVIYTGAGIRKAYKALKDNKILFLLGDQHAGDAGLEVDFLGRTTSTYRGVIKLAARTNSIIIPAYPIRQGFANFNIRFFPAIEINKNLNEKEEKALLKKLIQTTEEVVRENPDQWNWFYKRWKQARINENKKK